MFDLQLFGGRLSPAIMTPDNLIDNMMKIEAFIKQTEPKAGEADKQTLEEWLNSPPAESDAPPLPPVIASRRSDADEPDDDGEDDDPEPLIEVVQS